MPASRVCPCTGCAAHPGKCPAITTSGRCHPCTRTADRARGTRQQRGYDANHDRIRAQWAPLVATGDIRCPRCKQPIAPDEPWDLGHSDDRRNYTGPEHATCNRSAGGKAAHPLHGGGGVR